MTRYIFVAWAALLLVWPTQRLQAEDAPREGDGGGADGRLPPIRGGGPENGAVRTQGGPDRPPTTAQDRPEERTDGQRRPESDRSGAQVGADQRRTAGVPGVSEAKPGGVSVVRRPPHVLAPEQRTLVQEALRGIGAVPVHVDFDVDIGVVVPHTVALQPLPSMILSIVPGYAGFEFFEVPGQVVIVDPGTLVIVEILVL